MRVTLGFRDSSDIQHYAAEMLSRAPAKHKADLIARALWTYLGGKDMTQDDLAILLTGKPATYYNKVAVKPKKKAVVKAVSAEVHKEVREEPEPDTEEVLEPATESKTESDYPVFDAADAAMMTDVMAAFASQIRW